MALNEDNFQFSIDNLSSLASFCASQVFYKVSIDLVISNNMLQFIFCKIFKTEMIDVCCTHHLYGFLACNMHNPVLK